VGGGRTGFCQGLRHCVRLRARDGDGLTLKKAGRTPSAGPNLCAPLVKRALWCLVPALLLLAACDEPSSTAPLGLSSASPAVSAAAVVIAPSPTPSKAAPVAQPPSPTPSKAAPVAQPPAAPVAQPPAAQDPYAAAKAAGATAVCADGSWSYSQNRSGTCSHHGGVHWWTGNLGPAGPGGH
jgi:hypothetical protein